MRDETLCQAPTDDLTNGFDSLSVPVYRASTVVFPTVEAYNRRREALYDGYSYGLYGTPTTRALEEQISRLEDAARSLVLPSGLAAIALTTLSCAGSGRRVLFPDNVYDVVRPMAAELLEFYEVKYSFYDPRIGGGISELIDPSVSLVWVESPGSMTMEVQDVPAIVESAHAKGVPVAADNTWATSLRFKPLSHGVDYSVSAVSKYLGGHSDVVMGAISVSDQARYRRLKDFSRYLGYGVSADNCSLILRSISTLAVRLDRCEETALKLARWLQNFAAVKEVRHPALPTNPGHDFWKRDFSGSSGVFSLFLDPRTKGVLSRAIETLKLFAIGASWGGTHSIVAVSAEPPKREYTADLHDGPIVRLSIGLEHVDDLMEDLSHAMAILDACVAEHISGNGEKQ